MAREDKITKLVFDVNVNIGRRKIKKSQFERIPYWHMKMAVPVGPWLCPIHPALLLSSMESWFIGVGLPFSASNTREVLFTLTEGPPPFFYFLPGPPAPWYLSSSRHRLKEINFLPAQTVISQMTDRTLDGNKVRTREWWEMLVTGSKKKKVVPCYTLRRKGQKRRKKGEGREKE